MSHRFDEVRHSGVQCLCGDAGEALPIYRASGLKFLCDGFMIHPHRRTDSAVSIIKASLAKRVT
jgi:hypothetical protein